MSRDLKPKKSQPARKKARGGTLIGMFIGPILGWFLGRSSRAARKRLV